MERNANKHDWYNKEFKEQYIKDDIFNRSTETLLPYLFTSIADDEKRLNKDLCNFSIVQIEDYFLGLATSSISRCLNIRAQFVKYSQYCMQRGMIRDHQIHWLEVDRDFIKRCINYRKYRRSFVTRENLIDILENHVLNPCDRFVSLAIFEGVCGNSYMDLNGLTMDNFEYKNGKYWITVCDRTLQISELLYEYAKESADTFVLYCKDGKEKHVYDHRDSCVVKRKTNCITDDEHSFMRNISNKLSKLKHDNHNPVFAQTPLLNSGSVHFIHDSIQNGENVEDFIRSHKEEIVNRFGYYQTLEELVEQYELLYSENNC